MGERGQRAQGLLHSTTKLGWCLQATLLWAEGCPEGLKKAPKMEKESDLKPTIQPLTGPAQPKARATMSEHRGFKLVENVSSTHGFAETLHLVRSFVSPGLNRNRRTRSFSSSKVFEIPCVSPPS